MLGKLLESIMAQQILSLSDEHIVLPAQHKGARPSRLIDTTIDFLIQ
jgi:hypothetical protein